MNAPEPGTIKEFLANEEDTVTVGQDLLKLELGGPPKGGEKQKGGQEPKAPALADQPSSSDPEPKKDEAEPQKESTTPPPKKPEPQQQESKPSPPAQEPSAPREQASKPQEPKKAESKPKDAAPLGNREERRVSIIVTGYWKGD